MNFKFLSFFVLTFAFIEVKSQNASCDYYIYNEYWGYACKLNVEQSSDVNAINGQHFEGHKDENVRGISNNSKMQKFPTIVSEKFINLDWIELIGVEMEEIDKNSLESCENLEWLDLNSNNIKNLPEDLFKNNPKLKWLFLFNNKIENLPQNIFSYLTDLESLRLSENKLTTIHSYSFGSHPTLNILEISNNEINSIDETIFDGMPALMSIELGSNPCVDSAANFKTSSDAKKNLKKCFENYQKPIIAKNPPLKRENNQMKSAIAVLSSKFEKLSIECHVTRYEYLAYKQVTDARIKALEESYNYVYHQVQELNKQK